jgi:hypothetical protein
MTILAFALFSAWILVGIWMQNTFIMCSGATCLILTLVVAAINQIRKEI